MFQFLLRIAHKHKVILSDNSTCPYKICKLCCKYTHCFLYNPIKSESYSFNDWEPVLFSGSERFWEKGLPEQAITIQHPYSTWMRSMCCIIADHKPLHNTFAFYSFYPCAGQYPMKQVWSRTINEDKNLYVSNTWLLCTTITELLGCV